jgi:hypothetical protein
MSTAGFPKQHKICFGLVIMVASKAYHVLAGPYGVIVEMI